MSGSARTILQQILATKVEEACILRSRWTPRAIEQALSQAPPLRNFEAAVSEENSPGGPSRLIGEIKRASPSRGVLRARVDAGSLARSYAKGGAAAVSVLTDRRYFRGGARVLESARAACDLPVLAKDFFVDPIQIAHARVTGADAILLIVAALSRETLENLGAFARTLGLAAIYEVHNVRELRIAESVGARLIGINNRDLHTFQTHLETSIRLLADWRSEAIPIAESGIRDRGDVDRLEAAGARAFLVGQTLMLADDPVRATAALVRPTLAN